MIKLPGDDFLRGVVTAAEESSGIGEAVTPQDVGMQGTNTRTRVRKAGAKLGITGLIQGIAEEGIDRYVTPFLTDRITDAAKGAVALANNPSRFVQGTAGINPYGFGGGF